MATNQPSSGHSDVRVPPLSRWPRYELFWVALLLVVALGLRLAFHFRTPPFVGKDSQSYFLPGWSLANGEPFELGFRRTPGYPLFIAASVLVQGEELRALALAQHLVGVATVGLTYLLGRLTFGHLAGLLAGLGIAVSAPLLIYERYVMTETLFAFVLTATLLAAVWALRRETPEQRPADHAGGAWMPGRRADWARQSWPFLLVGLLLGTAALTRPIAQVAAPLVLVAIVARFLRRWQLAALAGVALLIGMLLVQGPWMLRNLVTQGQLSSSTFGRTLIARTAYYDRGFVFYRPGVTPDDPDPQKQRARQIVQEMADRRSSDNQIATRLREELGFGPVQVNAVLRDIAVEAILRDPVRFVSGTLRMAGTILVGLDERFLDHWKEYRDVNPWNSRIAHLVADPTPWEVRERSTAHRLASIFEPARVAGPLLALAAMGSVLGVLSVRHRPALLLGTTVLTFVLASAALDGPVERYRYPLDPAIAVLAAGGLAAGLGSLLRFAPRPLRSQAAPA